MKSKLEYIWLDGYTPTQNMRSKTKVVEDFNGTLEECPIWAFDGSSTKSVGTTKFNVFELLLLFVSTKGAGESTLVVAPKRSSLFLIHHLLN